ncbi:hypothetical protein SteCoe_11763 [Stentor coeruleus]|uniref:RanBP2-type domain-containing protein n=1 Tax=Stentor coeruleus TaxID=5963 RepID=A0A1R2CCD9_9CILI|nr:hypothetical protein SteCoe_11763 [Stentor coeruleus]
MDLDNFKSIVLEDYEESDVKGLKSVATLVISCKEMRKLLQRTHDSKNCLDHLCISCNFNNIFKSFNNKTKIDLSTLKRKLKTLSASKGIPNRNQLSDAMEILDFILNAFHCHHFEDYSNGISEALTQKNCFYNCCSHKLFGLRIKEEYTCKCRSSFEIKWENSNFFQYFNISTILSSVNYNHSINLLNVPKFLLTENTIPKNSHIKNQMINILSEKLKNAHRNLCSNENCIENSSSVKFILEEPPEMFIINLLWESNEIGHLDCYFSTISITGLFLISDIYSIISKQKFSIVGIMFLKDKDYEYAFRNTNLWYFKSYEKGISWLELVTNVVINKYHPVGLVYEKSKIDIELYISIEKLVWLEKTACKFDHCSLNLSESLYQNAIEKFDVSSSKKNIINNKPKVNKEAWCASEKPEKQNEDSSIFSQENSANTILNKWSCECGKENDNDNNICQRCKKVKHGLSGWVCFNCTFYNQKGFRMCRGCSVFEPNRNKWQCENCYNFNHINSQQCLSCKKFNRNNSSEAGKNIEKAQTENVVGKEASNLNSPECKASSENINYKDSHDESAKYSKETWLCMLCYTLNNSNIFNCKKCQKIRKDVADQKINEKPAEENKQTEWICDSCKSANDILLDKCKNCKKSYSEKSNTLKSFEKHEEKVLDIECKPEAEKSKENRICIKCKKENNYILETCLECINAKFLANSSVIPEEITEIKNNFFWICKKCSHQNNSMYYCFKCKNEKEEKMNDVAEIKEEGKVNDLTESKKKEKVNDSAESKEEEKVNDLTESKNKGKVNDLAESKEEEKVINLSKNDFWNCESCKNSTSTAKNICDFCDLSKGSLKESWVCRHCKKVNLFCRSCCLYCDKYFSKCENCEALVYSPEVFCDKCKKIKSSVEIFWECQSCNNKNEKNVTECKSCLKEKTQNISKDVQSLRNKNFNNMLKNTNEKPNCSKCNKAMLSVFCESCGKSVLYREKCINCGNHLADLTVCYICMFRSGLTISSSHSFNPK